MEESPRSSTPVLSHALMQPPLSRSPQKSFAALTDNRPTPTQTPQESIPICQPQTSNLDVGPTPCVQNIVSTVNLDCVLDLKKINFRTRNSEYNPKRFCGLVMRITKPRCTSLIFSSGKIVVTGVRSERDSVLASRKFARIIQKIGFPVRFTNFTIHNMVATCDLRFPLRLENLHQAHGQFSSYEPELFPALVYRMIRPRIVILIFVNGKLVVTGAKSRKDIHDGLEQIFPILKSFRKH